MCLPTLEMFTFLFSLSILLEILILKSARRSQHSNFYMFLPLIIWNVWSIMTMMNREIGTIKSVVSIIHVREKLLYTKNI